MEYVASISYGKDSLAMLHVVTDVLGWQLNRIVTADVWATDTIPADLPPMVEFKDKADKIIKERWGIEVEHFKSNKTYEEVFYRVNKKGKRTGEIMGFPIVRGSWCNSELKMGGIKKADKTAKGGIQYIGIAADEPNRFHNANDKTLLPLVEAGWTEADCRKWCEENDLLSPIYTQMARGGCWFCHNQTVNQLRMLRKQYPDYWQMMLKWDDDSPVTFRTDGHTVHDYDKRFQMEDEGYITETNFRWADLDKPQANLIQLIEQRKGQNNDGRSNQQTSGD